MINDQNDNKIIKITVIRRHPPPTIDENVRTKSRDGRDAVYFHDRNIFRLG